MRKFTVGVCGILLVVSGTASAQPISFTNIAPTAGVNFEHHKASAHSILAGILSDSVATPVPQMALPTFPHITYGLGGVAVFDYDADGDLDIFAPNGAGGANTLWQNQLDETGAATFVDRTFEAGVAALDMDGSGVCVGDVDNDGDADLLVTGRVADMRFYENLGDATFQERSDSGLDLSSYHHTSCAMGDINGDGFLDVVVGNNFDMDANTLPIFVVPFALNQPNELFLGNGDGTFSDVSTTSGIRDLSGVPPGAATITWSTAIVDIDMDGDSDIIFADDQAAVPMAVAPGGVDRGYVQVMINDGSGNFTAVHAPGAGAWMGLSFGDLNCDGTLDMYTTNMGDYGPGSLGFTVPNGLFSTRAHYGNGDGTFVDGGIPNGLNATSFGWGISMFDYDNDGDSDVVHQGGLEVGILVVADNPGTVIRNEGCGTSFTQDFAAFDVDHQRRNVRGVATGDLNRDGWVDVVSASNLVAPPPIPLIPSPSVRGSVLDGIAAFLPVMAPIPGGLFTWTGIQFAPGDVAVEINEGGNGNSGVAVRTIGTIGLVSGAVVNRDGIGAVASFRPHRGSNTAIMPVQAGGSHASSHAPEAYFGLGSARHGRLEVLWPGGVRNRLYGVRRGETANMPEIPCSIDSNSFRPYLRCVRSALSDLRDEGIITRRQRVRLLVSALLGYIDRS